VHDVLARCDVRHVDARIEPLPAHDRLVHRVGDVRAEIVEADHGGPHPVELEEQTIDQEVILDPADSGDAIPSARLRTDERH
jgi:hypothetical protein